MRRSTASLLLAIFLVSVFLRLYPLTSYILWGADIGEYHYLTHTIIENGSLPSSYDGWGFAYPLFPGMEILTAAASFSGMGLSLALSTVIPILASLIVFPVFVMTAGIMRDDRAGLIAAAFIAVAMPHVYATSHPMPGALGDLLFATCLLLFIKWLKYPKFGWLLFPATLALILTHHLSTYFLLICLVLGVFTVQLLRNRTSKTIMARELSYILFALLVTLFFWFVASPEFVEGVSSSESVLFSPLLLAGLAIVAAIALSVILARRRLVPTLVIRFPTNGRSFALFGVVLATSTAILLVNAFVITPGTSIELSPVIALLFLPLVLFISFAGPGTRPLGFFRGGHYPLAWVLAISFSTLAGVAMSSTVLIPYRHMQYLMIPLAILAGVGFIYVSGLAHRERSARRLGVATAVALVLVGTNAAVAYPPRELIAGYQEGLLPEALTVALWSDGNIDGLVAADHVASTVLFGFGGVHPTWDTASQVFRSPDFDGARDELTGVETPSGSGRIDWVILNRDTEEGVFLHPWDPSTPMTWEAVEKFGEEPFQLLLDDGYSRVYFINWGLD